MGTFIVTLFVSSVFSGFVKGFVGIYFQRHLGTGEVDDSVVKNTCCSSRGPKFCSQYPLQVALTSPVVKASGDLIGALHVHLYIGGRYTPGHTDFKIKTKKVF